MNATPMPFSAAASGRISGSAYFAYTRTTTCATPNITSSTAPYRMGLPSRCLSVAAVIVPVTPTASTTAKKIMNSSAPRRVGRVTTGFAGAGAGAGAAVIRSPSCSPHRVSTVTAWRWASVTPSVHDLVGVAAVVRGDAVPHLLAGHLLEVGQLQPGALLHAGELEPGQRARHAAEHRHLVVGGRAHVVLGADVGVRAQPERGEQ